jgi:hypothetical protein
LLDPGPLPCRSKAGRLVPTRMAPARPEVEDDDLPFEGGEHDGGTLVTYDRELEVWSGHVDGDRHRRPLRRAEDAAGTATPCGRPPDREDDDDDDRDRESCCQPPAGDVGLWVPDLVRIHIGGERMSHQSNLLRGHLPRSSLQGAGYGAETGSDLAGTTRRIAGTSVRFIPVPDPGSPEVAGGIGLSGRLSEAPVGRLMLRTPGFLIDGPRATRRRSGKPSPRADFPAGTVVANVAGEVGV